MAAVKMALTFVLVTLRCPGGGRQTNPVTDLGRGINGATNPRMATVAAAAVVVAAVAAVEVKVEVLDLANTQGERTGQVHFSFFFLIVTFFSS